jgi:hypothetical protein
MMFSSRQLILLVTCRREFNEGGRTLGDSRCQLEWAVKNLLDFLAAHCSIHAYQMARAAWQLLSKLVGPVLMPPVSCRVAGPFFDNSSMTISNRGQTLRAPQPLVKSVSSVVSPRFSERSGTSPHPAEGVLSARARFDGAKFPAATPRAVRTSDKAVEFCTQPVTGRRQNSPSRTAHATLVARETYRRGPRRKSQFEAILLRPRECGSRDKTRLKILPAPSPSEGRDGEGGERGTRTASKNAIADIYGACGRAPAASPLPSPPPKGEGTGRGRSGVTAANREVGATSSLAPKLLAPSS